MIYICGLGNPDNEYEGTRHNTGRMAVKYFASKNGFDDFSFDKKSKSSISKSEIKNNKMTLILPETFMNKSGNALLSFIKPKTGKNKKIDNLVVVYDDLDLPIGTIKISYNKGSGGHRGLESIIKSLKSKEFTRIRVGISSATSSGKIKKPLGEKVVLDFILRKFKESENEILKKVFKEVSLVINEIIENGREIAMNKYN